MGKIDNKILFMYVSKIGKINTECKDKKTIKQSKNMGVRKVRIMGHGRL